MTNCIKFVCTHPPGPESQFVEVEDENGRSFRAGEWAQRVDGLWELTVPQPLLKGCLPHVHVAGTVRGLDIDTCALCGEDIRSEVHRRTQ